MPKTQAQLDKEIEQYLANPKLGDSKWEREWADLLFEKNAKSRMPTATEVAHAYAYITREWKKKDRLTVGQWGEALAFGQHSGIDAEDKREAEEWLSSTDDVFWLKATTQADALLREQGESARYARKR